MIFASRSASIASGMLFGNKAFKELFRALAAADTTGEVTLTLTVPNAKLWDVEHPNLYTCRVRFGSDEDLQTFGIRTLSWGMASTPLLASKSASV